MIMSNTFREKLNNKEPTIGTHFLSPDPDVPEIIGDTGLYDYGEFCAEYAAFDMPILYHMARSGQCANLPLMIKPDQKSESFWAQAALGAGFKAVLFTDIRTPEDVARCHQAIRPDTPTEQGHMGVKLRRPALTGYAPEGYIQDLQSIVFLIMIEKNVAVENIDEILLAAKKYGVDMTQWGPADYGFSLGNPNLMNTPEIRPAEELVIRKCLEHDIYPRIEIGDSEKAKRYVDLGVRHFCVGWDRFFYKNSLVQTGENMQKLVETL
jgi:4-hydroxy-2-oxoheptanedioate aldolase